MTNTRVILLVIVHSVVHAALADDAEIVFNLYRKAFDDYQCAAAYRPIALEDNVTSIRVYVNSSVYITSGYCYDQNSIKTHVIKTNNNNTFLAEKQYVFKDVDLYIWTCYFYGTLPRILIICETISFHIRTKTPTAQIYLNSIKLAAIPTPLSVREYDAAASYYFGDDETVVIDCKRSLGVGYLKITYNTDGILLGTKYSPRYIEGVHIKLTQKSHSKYVDCYYKKYTTYNSYDISVTRIFFWSLSAGYSENNFASKYWMWISGGVVMIVIINIVIVYVIKNFKNKRKMRQSGNMDLVNSPNNGGSPLPHPRQWDEANNTKLIEPEMYNEPDHENRIIMNKKRANKIHNKTTNNVGDNYYANMDITSHNVVMEPALIYADIFNANNGKSFEKADAAIYSQVRLTGTNIAGSNYENVSISPGRPGPSYVNSHVGNEIEPTYCEVKAQTHI